MADAKKYLLSTRPLPKAVVAEAAARNVVIDELSFISTTPVQDEAVHQTIQALATTARTVVFTSMNAVEAVAAQLTTSPPWHIYALGNTTRKLIEQSWGAGCLVGTAENALRLGERLIDDGVLDVLFFCGNIRRNELPNKIRSEGGTVEEVIVYETEETPVALTRDYDGVLFFSPSAVQSFYRQNRPSKDTIAFAIGATTAEALRQQKVKNIVVGNETDKTELARLAVNRLSEPAA